MLIESVNGNVYQTWIKPTTSFLGTKEKDFRKVHNPQDGPIIGLYAEVLSTCPEARRVLVATRHKLLHFVGRISGRGHQQSLHSKFFEGEPPVVHEVDGTGLPVMTCLAVSPDQGLAPSYTGDGRAAERAYSWLCSDGVYHGKLNASLSDSVLLDKGKQAFPEPMFFSLELGANTDNRRSRSCFSTATLLYGLNAVPHTRLCQWKNCRYRSLGRDS